MKVAIMQPYFLPYIGYYQLMAAVDLFVVYDNIKYTKKGWINRNRMLLNGADAVFSLPLKKASDSLCVIDRELAGDFDRVKLLNQFMGAYARAPQFAATQAMIEQIVRHEEANLFHYIRHGLTRACAHLGIASEIRASSTIAIDHELTNQDKVLAICRAVGADTYVNAIGGKNLYSAQDFDAHGIELKFIASKPLSYPQYGGEFVPWLSIVDVLMFNPLAEVRSCVAQNYDLI